MNLIQKLFHKHNLLATKIIYPAIYIKNITNWDSVFGIYYSQKNVDGTAIILECDCRYSKKEVREGKWEIHKHFPIRTK